jgi:flagellar operon protein
MSDPINNLKMTSIQKTVSSQPTALKNKPSEQNSSFNDIIAQKIRQNSSIEFSKHAIQRVIDRDIEMSSEQMERLNHGVFLAAGKGLNNTLILIDTNAFVVNIHNNKVITAVSESGLKGNVFTNIDGAVIV